MFKNKIKSVLSKKLFFTTSENALRLSFKEFCNKNDVILIHVYLGKNKRMTFSNRIQIITIVFLECEY